MKKSILTSNEIHRPAVSKKAKNSKTIVLRTVILLFLVFSFSQVFSTKNEKVVLDAFELRKNGKILEAKQQLEFIISQDSTNAMAHFELARTLNYMNLRGSKLADKHLGKALKLAPNSVVYNYYKAGNCFLKAYIALQTGGDNPKELVGKACEEYVKVLELKPDYTEAMMYLVEFYGMLPEDLGGNMTKAEEYAQKLESIDKYYGAKARLVMMPDGTDMIEYWRKFIRENGESYRALKELGVACIFKEDIESARIHFEKAMLLDASQNIRLLDLARYHQMKVMQNRDLAKEELPKSKVYIEKYLNSKPEPIPPLKAYAMGMLAKAEMFQGNREEGQKIMQEARILDPHFSRAFGIPSQAIFEAPNKVNHHFSSFFSPY